MTQHRVRQSTTSRLSKAGILRVGVEALFLATMTTFTATGQAPTPTFSINDATVSEGNSGTSTATFTATLSNRNGTESRVRYTTTDQTARGGVLTRVFSRTGSTIPDAGAEPSPFTINVSGVTDPLLTLSVLIQGLTHPNPDHLDLLLVAPDGTKVVLQSDAAGGGGVNAVTYRLRDGEPPMPLNLLGGAFSPTSNPPSDLFAAPAPPGPHPEAAPAGSATLNGVFGGMNPNGDWTLWVVDDTAGGQGSIAAVTLAIGVRDPAADYVPTTGELVFPPGGPTTQTVTVPIFGDTTVEPNETFVINLASPVNADLGDDLAIGSILNDDGGSGGSAPTAVSDRYVGGPIAGPIARLAADGVLSNDLPNGGGPMTAVLVEGPRNGSLTLQADGGFIYIPNSRNVPDEFTYRAVNAFGSSDIVVVTLIDPATAQLLSPNNLRVRSVDEQFPFFPSRRVTVGFDPPADGSTPTEYALAGGVQPGQTLAFVRTGSAFPIFTFDAPSSGSFFIRMHALLGTGQSGPSNEVPLHVNTTVPPSAPANLLGAVDGSNLTLAWKDTFLGGIPTYSFVRVTGDASVTIPLGTSQTFSFPTVPPGSYTFEVLNGNIGGVSAASNAVTLTFPGPCSPPEMPEDFLLYVEGLILGAIWDLPANGPAPDGYLLHVTSTVFTGPLPTSTRNIRAQVPPGAYTVSVQARNGCGLGAQTATQTVVVP